VSEGPAPETAPPVVGAPAGASRRPAPLPEPLEARIRNGAFVLIDKPRGPTSHQVTAWVRDLLGVPRAGHAGTLDPHVSGLLWIGVGPALKLLPLMLAFPKRYVAAVALHADAPPRAVDRVLAEFRGPIYQTPPVRSAVKRERRVRTIHRLDLVEREGLLLLLDITADSGTYVRTLAVDLGDALGTGAHLAELRRVATGPFREERAISMHALADAAATARSGDGSALAGYLHPLDEVWREFPPVVIKDSAVGAIAHGADLASGGILSMPRAFGRGAHVVLVTRRGELVALGVALRGSGEIPKTRHGWVVDATRVFVEPTRPVRSGPTERNPVTERSTEAPIPSELADRRD
jgi:H/ACA ribonucleoprotein complex subunit 4